MTRSLFTAAVLFLSLEVTSLFAQDISFDRYHSQEEINNYMKEVATTYPEFASVHLLGQSQQGREIYYLILGNPSLPTVYLNGTHHGNEKSSTETTLGIIDYILDERETPEMQALLQSYSVLVQPLVNPDGHAANTRHDARGRDPNRDYSFPERSDEQSFKVPEIGLVKSLFDSLTVRAAAAFHSGMEGVLWPWCHTGDRNPHHDTFSNLSRLFAQAMGMSIFRQSYYDYATDGEFIDFAYMRQQSLAVTVEVSNAGNPPANRLGFYVNRAVQGTIEFMRQLKAIDSGNLASL